MRDTPSVTPSVTPLVTPSVTASVTPLVTQSGTQSITPSVYSFTSFILFIIFIAFIHLHRVVCFSISFTMCEIFIFIFQFASENLFLSSSLPLFVLLFL